MQVQNKTFRLLLPITLASIVINLSLSLASSFSGDTNEIGSPFFPELSETSKSINHIDFYLPGNTIAISLTQHNDSWFLNQRDNYPADSRKVQKFLTDLASANIYEQKTINPDLYAVLGVEEISKQDAQGILFMLNQPNQESKKIAQHSAIIGKDSPLSAFSYVRKTGHSQSYLLDKKLSIDQEPSAWLLKDILDIRPEEIRAISITHKDGEVIQASKKAKQDMQFYIANIPTGKTQKDFAIAPASNAVSELQLEDVVSKSDDNQEDYLSTTVIYHLFNGYKVVARTYMNGDEKFVSFDTYDAGSQKLTKKTRYSVDGRWFYKIPDFAFDGMNKRLADTYK